jgi:hypothetical protein
VQDITENYKFWPINSTSEILIQHWLGKVEKNEKKIITLDSSYPGRDSDQVAPNMSRASLLHPPAEDWLRKGCNMVHLILNGCVAVRLLL